MTKIRVFFATLICKLAGKLLRLGGSGGTNLPGKLALKIYPDLLGVLAKNVNVIMVTGTNGKTTTSRIIEEGLIEAKVTYFSNKSGANLLPGITNSFVSNSTLTGKNKCNYAMIECDEAAFRTVSLYVKPKVLVVTNIFRDQLDRYGEITHTLNSINTGMEHLPDTTFVLNGDCSLTYSLAEKFPNNKIVTFGVDKEIYHEKVHEISDAKYCIKCKTAYDYDYITFGHLGDFHCPKCGYHRVTPQVAAEDIIETTANSSTILLRLFGNKYTAKINLPGGYNIYNACAAAAALSLDGFSDDICLGALQNFFCGFGRMEKFTINNTDIRMILVKNPAGCNQVLNFLSDCNEDTLFYICLNDNAADGKDISWIWDVEFERLHQLGDRLKGLVVSGIRANDMALRLKYAGFDEDFIKIIDNCDYDKLIDSAINQDLPVCIMPTYTSMMDLRARIAKRFHIKNFWE